jgi:hypothetical protein|tara:strand:- start:4812 stop:5003 length:192 start_codon:yes stop_codon:yes gene_type:complete
MKTLLNKAVFINKELVDHFKLLFPNTLPMKKGITPEEIAFLQGQQSVIERMTFILDDDLTEEK